MGGVSACNLSPACETATAFGGVVVVVAATAVAAATGVGCGLGRMLPG